ncbi:MAG: hypothetical protein M2R45_03333 [Verrucomicrobia subdivision 3 bacterium]|nr:hypothetical protein [Limisphaerales bacterium]MCS1415386.1 hypothetical protein [Limisphaerales bacterium]
MKTFSGVIERSTQGNCQLLDITKDVQSLVSESGVKTGQMTAMVVGSTASLSTVEFESGLVNTDIAAALERLAPANDQYEHEAIWHDDNGHSHIRATLVGFLSSTAKSRLAHGNKSCLSTLTPVLDPVKLSPP